MLGLRLTRVAPRLLQQPLASGASKIRTVLNALRLGLEKRRTPVRVPPDSPTIVIGLFSSPSGIGQGARLMWHDLKQRGTQVLALDVTESLRLPGGMEPQGVLDETVLGAVTPGTIVIHLNPPLYGTMYLRLPRQLRRRSSLVAYWAWELDQIPKSWLVDARAADEIWVPSAFVAEAVRRRLGPEGSKPVKIVPHAVHACPPASRKTPEITAAVRARHGLPVDVFIVGYSFAMKSNYARKNPLAVIAAFRAAFPPGERAALLILRCTDLREWQPGAAELVQAMRQDVRIVIVDNQTRQMPIADFYQAIDVYLSLHRSEGYGLNLAEAASTGTAVLATGWRIATDIAALPEFTPVAWSLIPVDDPQRVYTADGAHWAEPDLADAVAKLRALSQRMMHNH